MSEKSSSEESKARDKKLSKGLYDSMQSDEISNQNEKQYRDILSSIEDGYYEVDIAGNLSSFNDALCKIYGYARDELMGMNNREYMTPETAKKAYSVFNGVYKTGEPARIFDWEFLKKDGTKIDVAISVSLIKNSKGEAVGYRGIVRDIGEHKLIESALKKTHEELERRVAERTKDLIQINKRLEQEITERKSIEDALRESEKKYREIFEKGADLLYIHDLEGNLIQTNSFFKKACGWSPDELDNVNIRDLVPERYRHQVKDYLKSILENGKDEGFMKVLRKDDREIIIEYNNILICNETGPTGVQGSGKDITERLKNERALKESEEKYRNILESIEDGYYEVDLSGNFTFFNNAMCRILGYSSSEMMGMNNRVFMDQGNARKVFQTFNDAFTTGKPTKAFDWVLINKNGSTSVVEIVVSLIKKEDGKPVGFRGIARDITERKHLEERLRQSQKMEAIGTMAGGIAHDFNNILSSILGYTELALDDTVSGTVLHENLSEVFSAGNRATDLVQQIITLSRHSPVAFKPSHINPLVKEAVKMLRAIIPTSIEIKENICSDRLIVHADPTQIHQVIINLAINAKHAMSKTGGELAIEVDSFSHAENKKVDDRLNYKMIDLVPGNYARITVSDTGTGIAKEHLNKIFEPYFTTKAVGEGSGLGLSVVRGIVKSHRGDIAVFAELGKGTTFHIYLPLSEQQSIELPDTNADPLPRGTERILLVDDEPSIVKMQQRSLEHLGYTITPHTNSIEALEAFRTSPDTFDLVITDMSMPKMTGDKFAEEIKKIRSDVPVILCTGFSDQIKIRTGTDMQIDAFLMKPINKAKLTKTIRKLLDKVES